MHLGFAALLAGGVLAALFAGDRLRAPLEALGLDHAVFSEALAGFTELPFDRLLRGDEAAAPAAGPSSPAASDLDSTLEELQRLLVTPTEQLLVELRQKQDPPAAALDPAAKERTATGGAEAAPALLPPPPAPRTAIRPAAAPHKEPAPAEPRNAAAASAPLAQNKTRVSIHYGANDRMHAVIVSELASYLQARGFNVSSIRPVELTIKEPSVRYFFASDEAKGEQLIHALDRFLGALSIPAPNAPTDFTGFEPKPKEGALELWLAPS